MTIVEIILFFLTVSAIFTAVYFYLSRRKTADKAVMEANKDLKRQIRFSNDEVLRYKTLYEGLKNAPEPQVVTTPDENISPEEVFKTAERIIIEQQKLEIEKSEIAERNKKLWDMSLSINKEKEHIEILKNDIEEKHHSVTESIGYARRIQLAVLPDKAVLKHCFNDYFLFWRPRDIVSGDFYWMKLSGDIIAFTVADCTGHGVPGAFMSLLGVTFLNEICANLNEDTLPNEILETLRADIIRALSQDNSFGEQDDGMDMALCILNLKTKKLRFSGANNPMYLVRQGELKEFKAVRNPIGSYGFVRPFTTEEIIVETGDWIYMSSDGYSDQFGGADGDRKLTYKRFRELLTSVSIYQGREQSERLGVFLSQWRGQTMQLDDVLVGGYQIK
ncbi:MAG: SpoIIE family protein phosphatase [Bacteroidales bacterium]|nr:SpoIIE family protein phosphatase [Bacteroidales bacterium]